MRRFAWVLFLFLGLPAIADNGEELQRLQDALQALRQEQQAVYQQFQMVQELRRANLEALSLSQAPALQYSTEVVKYADVAEAQKKMVRRAGELAQEADELYARYSEIEARKKPLQERIYELAISR